MNKLRITDYIFSKDGKVRLFGELYDIKYTDNLRGLTNITDGVIYYSGLEDSKVQKVTAFLKDMLLFNIKSILQIQQKMNVKPRKISIRLCKTRWGSCNNYGDLSFNLLLVVMPLRLIEYVVIHELAHIKEMNHSKKFWAIVEKFCPDYKILKKDLNEAVRAIKIYG